MSEPPIFISGHTDLTETEFNAHYKPLLDKAVQEKNFYFCCAGAYGTDLRCISYLIQTHHIPFENITIYLHKNYASREQFLKDLGFKVKGPYATHALRDADLTRDSCKDIAWYRSIEDVRQRYSPSWKPDHSSAVQKNIERRQSQVSGSK